MSLTASQFTIFKTAILAETDPTLVAARNSHSDQGIADWYNGDHASQMVWKPAVAVSDVIAAMVGAEFLATSQSQQNLWQTLTSSATVDATNANIRTDFAAIFGGGSVTVTNLTAIAQRKATRFETLFSVGGICSLFGYRVSATDAALAQAS
jgi:hypothetical protein